MDPAQAVLSCLDTTGPEMTDSVGRYRGHDCLCGVEIVPAQGAESIYTSTKLETSGLRGWIEGSRDRTGAQLRLIVAGAYNLDEMKDITDRVRFERVEMRFALTAFSLPGIICVADDQICKFWWIPETTQQAKKQTYFANLGEIAATWSFESETGTTLGVVLFLRTVDGIGRDRIRLLGVIERLKDLVHLPEVLPFAILDTVVYSMSNDLRRHGHHISMMDTAIEESFDRHDRGKGLSLTHFSAATTFRAANVAISQRAVQVALDLCRHVSEKMHHGLDGVGPRVEEIAEPDRQALQTGLGCLQQSLCALQRTMVTYQDRMSNQLTTILGMISQQDQDVSINIAEASKTIALEAKRDGSSMKTIAGVTMVFLPGTFVASIFAMPMFDWRAPFGSIVSGRLWIYFVVTIPLTLATCAVWWLWLRFKEKVESPEHMRGSKSSSIGSKAKKLRSGLTQSFRKHQSSGKARSNLRQRNVSKESV